MGDRKRHNLTDAERACVSRKIPRLLDEGMDRDQAVAVAIKTCAQGKRAEVAADEELLDEGALRPPVYRWRRELDGTYTILDVPIFSAHEHEASRRSFGEDWLMSAYAQARLREREGYLPPLHVRHHGEGEPVQAAGKFRVRRLGSVRHDGREVPTLFADLVGVPEEVFRRLMRGELSYRSVEILDVTRPEIDSLALLDDEVPYFRFPLLRLAAEEGDPQTTKTDQRSPVLAYSALGPRASVLSSYMEASYMEHNKEPHKRAEDVQGDEKGEEGAKGNGTKARKKIREARRLGYTLEEIGKATDRSPGVVGAIQDGEIKNPPDDFIKKIDALISRGPKDKEKAKRAAAQSLEDAVAAAVKILTEAISSMKSPAEVGQGPVEAPKPGMAASAEAAAGEHATSVVSYDARTEGQVVAMTARVAALEEELATLRRERAVEERAAKLVAAGFGDEVLAKFRATARSKGLEVALAFADAAEQIGAPRPPATHWTGEIRAEEPDPPELAKYAARGPEVLDAARDLYRSWRRLGSEVPFDEFFAANHDADAFLGLARATGKE